MTSRHRAGHGPPPHRDPDRSRERDFRLFWAGDGISQAGTAVTLIALPLVAVATLRATPLQVSLLVMAEYLAFALVGLPAGAWVDRMRQRRTMIVCDLGRAALFASVPVAACLHVLTLPQLYAVAFGSSLCTVFADVAAQSHLPYLVGGRRLVRANVRLETTRNLAQAGGPAVGGLLVAMLTAPFALAVDAASYALSALALSGIRRAEPRSAGGSGTGTDPAGGTATASGAVAGELARLRAEIGVGLRFVFGHRRLRAITLAAAVSNLSATVGATMLLILLNRELGLPAALCGLVFTAEAVGGLLGALLVERVVARLGRMRAMRLSVAGSGGVWLLAVPMYQADWRFAVAVALQALGWLVFMTFKITAVSYRQEVCPEPLLGRMTATVRFVVWGCMPVGALLGGLLGQGLGPRPAMWIGAVAELLAVLPLLRWRRRTVQAPLRPADAPPPEVGVSRQTRETHRWQRAVPPALLGRVGAVGRLAGLAGLALGALAGGWLARSFGLQMPFAAAAALLVGSAVLAAAKLPRYLDRERGDFEPAVVPQQRDATPTATAHRSSGAER